MFFQNHAAVWQRHTDLFDIRNICCISCGMYTAPPCDLWILYHAFFKIPTHFRGSRPFLLDLTASQRVPVHRLLLIVSHPVHRDYTAACGFCRNAVNPLYTDDGAALRLGA